VLRGAAEPTLAGGGIGGAGDTVEVVEAGNAIEGVPKILGVLPVPMLEAVGIGKFNFPGSDPRVLGKVNFGISASVFAGAAEDADAVTLVVDVSLTEGNFGAVN
jgi:hypothetical protein